MNIAVLSQAILMFLVPVNQKVPLWQAERIWGGCGPAVLQVQDDVWVWPLQDPHLNIHWFPEHFGDWVVCWSVEGAIRCLFYKHKSAGTVLDQNIKSSAPAGIVGSSHSYPLYILLSNTVHCPVWAPLWGVLQQRPTQEEEHHPPPRQEPPQLYQSICTETITCWEKGDSWLLRKLQGGSKKTKISFTVTHSKWLSLVIDPLGPIPTSYEEDMWFSYTT